MRRSLLLASGALVAALATACSTAADASYGTGYGAPPPATRTAVASLATAQSVLGSILTDGQGRAVYLFDADTGPVSNCAGTCAAVWPPVSASGTPVAGPGLDAALLGSHARADGSTQLTYAGHPLYYFVKDTGPSTTAGEGITNFGGSWFVVDAAGRRVEEPSGTGY